MAQSTGGAMLRSSIVRIVDWCTRHAWPVIALTIGLAMLSAVYATQHFAIATDIKDLFPRDLPWTQRAYRYLAAFPERGIIAVIDAPTPELVEQASARLSAALAEDRAHFRSVEEAQGGAFLAHSGLLFPATDEVARIAGGMEQAAPLIGGLAADPSLRGALGALSTGLTGAANGVYRLDALVRPMNMAADTIDNVLAGRPASFSWRALAAGQQPQA